MTLKILGVCSSHQDQHFWLLNHLIRSCNEKGMIETRNLKSWRNSALHLFQFFFKLCLEERRRAFKRIQEGEKNEPINMFHITIHVWGACGTRPPHVATKLGCWPCLLLSRTARILRPYPGLRTPILNPSLDYESWLPHAQQWLWNFDKILKIHLGIRRWKQLNEWERKSSVTTSFELET